MGEVHLVRPSADTGRLVSVERSSDGVVEASVVQRGCDWNGGCHCGGAGSGRPGCAEPRAASSDPYTDSGGVRADARCGSAHVHVDSHTHNGTDVDTGADAVVDRSARNPRAACCIHRRSCGKRRAGGK